MPNDYISREAAQYKIREQNIHPETDYGQALSDAVAILQRIPAADVMDVVHGYWIQHDSGPLKSECSACRTTFNIRIEYDEFTTKLCPHCGAKMDGGEHHAD